MENTKFMEFVSRIHKDMIDNKILLVYEGEVNQDITKAFTTMTEKNLEEDEQTSISIKKRVYHVMVECLQNIGRHSDNIDSGMPEIPGNGIFIVCRNDEGFNVVTGNPIANSKIDQVTTMLEKVNNMSEEEVKAYYKQKILESRISEKGGAGLGFIDIVKKTGNKIHFHFEKINDLTSFFIVKTQIS